MKEVWRGNILQHFLHHFVTSHQRQAFTNSPCFFFFLIYERTTAHAWKELQDGKRNLCNVRRSSKICHLLNPLPWQNGHGSTHALVAMGFHFSPNYDVKGACMLSNCYKEAMPKIDRPCYKLSQQPACLSVHRGQPQHIDSSAPLTCLCFQTALSL